LYYEKTRDEQQYMRKTAIGRGEEYIMQVNTKQEEKQEEETNGV